MGLGAQDEGQLRGSWKVMEQGFKSRPAELQGPCSLTLTAERECKIESTPSPIQTIF